MLVTESLSLQLSDLLDRIGTKLQISPTQHKQAEERYGRIADWLSADGTPLAAYSPTIYAQGSLRIGTTVRPLARQEYDLDLVLELQCDWRQIQNPVVLLNAVEARLRQHDVYKTMLSRKNRCIRVRYADEFHLDILPACPDVASGADCVVVPDRGAKAWKASNPKGYAEWFEKKAKGFKVEFAKQVEPLPDWQPSQTRPPLSRAVQLLKRWRDVTYSETKEIAPISIVLTTLAGQNYGGQEFVNEAMDGILEGIVGSIPPPGRRLTVLNPTNLKEDLSERWNGEPDAYRAFVTGITALRGAWKELQAQRGLPQVKRVLERLFGVDPTTAAMEEQAKYIQSFRAKETLGVRSGSGVLSSIVTQGSVPVRRNTFYGEGS